MSWLHQGQAGDHGDDVAGEHSSRLAAILVERFDGWNQALNRAEKIPSLACPPGRTRPASWLSISAGVALDLADANLAAHFGEWAMFKRKWLAAIGDLSATTHACS